MTSKKRKSDVLLCTQQTPIPIDNAQVTHEPVSHAPKSKRQKILDSLLRVGNALSENRLKIATWKDYVPFVVKHASTFQAVANLTAGLMQKVEDQKRETKLCEETKKYAAESKSQRSVRARDFKEWIEVDKSELPGLLSDLEYVSLCRQDDCWYKGNLDRMEGCQISRLVGTKTVFLCDVCMANFLDSFADALEKWDDNLTGSIY